MEPFVNERTGLYRPRVPKRIPRSIPDEEFNEIFARLPNVCVECDVIARLPSHRDRALVAFYVSTGPGRRSCCRRRRAGSIRDGS